MIKDFIKEMKKNKKSDVVASLCKEDSEDFGYIIFQSFDGKIKYGNDCGG